MYGSPFSPPMTISSFSPFHRTNSFCSFLVCVFDSIGVFALDLMILRMSEPGGRLKFPICSMIAYLSSISCSLPSSILSTLKSLSRGGSHAFARYLLTISLHLSRLISFESLLRYAFIRSFALAVFTKDNQKGLGLRVLSVSISTTSPFRSSLSSGCILPFTFEKAILFPRSE